MSLDASAAVVSVAVVSVAVSKVRLVVSGVYGGCLL